MIIPITPDTHGQIRNPVFAEYAAMYLGIYDRFMAQIGATGIEVDPQDYAEEVARRRERLRQKGAHVRNGGRSIYLNAISPACVACKTGAGSTTFFISLRCHRDCYYCFNPNQMDYEFHISHTRDLVQELDELAAQGQQMECLALTGGEPLLHKEEALAFFRHARKLFPDVHARLYTCGDYVDEPILQELQAATLNEIRFSIRMHDSPKAREHVLKRIELARQYIPQVMVEMPVPPGTQDEMRALLLELNRIGIFSINLLEFCFPLFNAEEYNQRGYAVKTPPYRVTYNYWYAGGLPVAQSELDSLELLEFALDNGFKMGVHYCSLENKHTGQVYQQNHSGFAPEMALASKKDFFFKTAKVFGEDVPRVKKVLEKRKKAIYNYQKQFDCLEFRVRDIRALQGLDVEIGIATSILEQRGGETLTRELKMELTTPRLFNLEMDI